MSNMNDIITIRSAQVSDANELAAVHEAAWRYTYFGVISGLDVERYIAKKGTHWWAMFLKRKPNILVMSFDHSIAGYANIGHIRNQSLPYTAEITELYFHPTYHGLGLGRKLFTEAKNKLKNNGLKGLFVWALEDNHPAMKFYAQMGGQIVAQQTETFGQSIVKKIGFGWN